MASKSSLPADESSDDWPEQNPPNGPVGQKPEDNRPEQSDWDEEFEMARWLDDGGPDLS